eukprot:1144424-Pelagomonas_calceolata.AAC.3
MSCSSSNKERNAVVVAHTLWMVSETMQQMKNETESARTHRPHTKRWRATLQSFGKVKEEAH